MSFDPNAAAMPGTGIYGLPFSENEAHVVVLPAPFDATTSYRRGAAKGPKAIVEASRQVDLFDLEVGRPYERGIALLERPRTFQRIVARLNRGAITLADPIIEKGGDLGKNKRLASSLARVNAISTRVNGLVHSCAKSLIERGKLVALIGGDHSTPFGSIQAHAEAFPGMGILHLDAHADLRPSYEGFTDSHASIMFNVLERLPGVSKLVQVGVRDLCEQEFDLIQRSNGRVVTHFDALLARERDRGVTFAEQCRRVVEALPREVYLSFDIDGLDPTLCPHTGTPVPGGLSFQQACALAAEVAQSGRRIVGLDLNEVAPGPRNDEWDANVGARLLYKMIGWALISEAA